MTWHNKVDRATAQARLMIASPEQVFAELKEYAAYTRQRVFGTDEGLEEALFLRNDPLINLGLAQYASSQEIVTALYKSGSIDTGDLNYLKALRLACLSNEIMPRRAFLPFYGFESDEIQRLALDGDRDEIEILMGNPSMGKILGHLYNRTGPFSDVSDERLLFLVNMSIGNPRININDDDDGYDNDFQAIHEGIFNLLRTAPLKIEWLKAIHSLLCHVDPLNRTSIHYPRVLDLNKIIARWSNTKSDTSNDNVQGLYTSLTLVDEFRCLIAALFGEPMLLAKVNEKLEDSDIFVRCAWYGTVPMSPEKMQTCWERDGNIFAFSALQNSNMYCAKCRPILAKIIPYGCEEFFKVRCEKWGEVSIESAEMEKLSRIENKINNLIEWSIRGAKIIFFGFFTLIVIILLFNYRF